MARVIYATHVTCDGCGITEQLPAPSARGVVDAPPGWSPPGLQVVDVFRTPFLSDLCAACMARPLAELVAPHLEQTP